MVAIRVRHPRGVTTLEVDPDSQTVDDLKVLVFSATEIAPDEQQVKYGYPPKPLPNTDGFLSTIPITKGEQIIVTAVPATTGATPSAASRPAEPTPAPSVKPLNDSLSAPAPSSSSSFTQSDIPLEGNESVALPGRDAGHLQLRVVPDDNSCLFSALGVIFEGGIESAQKLRQVIADEIRVDPFSYSDVMLGQPRDQYVRKMLQKDTWGGAIELSIFSKHYKTEISSFDVASGRCDRFGEGQYDSRCLVVYSGIHYDALSLAPFPAAPPAFHTTIFPVSDDAVMAAAEQLISQLRARHYYTDTANFDLRCGVCRVGLKGESGAKDHAMQTGHVEFGEY